MVSVNPAQTNSVADLNTLKLIKAQSRVQPIRDVVQPTVDTTMSDRFLTIADLAKKYLDIKAGRGGQDAADQGAPSHVGNGQKPLTTDEQAAERANFERYFQRRDDDDRANFSKKVTDLLSQNDFYKNDPSFQAALKNGTLSIESGSVVGIKDSTRTILYDDNGYYAGAKQSGFETSDDIWAKIENLNGRFVSKTDGKNVAIGQMNQLSFYATWPAS